jgi:NADH-quinone oxidoreductase subunit M
MITSLLIFIPFIAALIVLLTRNETAKKVAFSLSLVEFVVSIFAYLQFKNDPDCNCFSMVKDWIPSFGIYFRVSMDGISLLMVLLTTTLVPLIILSSFRHHYRNSHHFYALILMMQMALVGVFVANDGFLFYVFWELALIPIYFICLVWGGAGSPSNSSCIHWPAVYLCWLP